MKLVLALVMGLGSIAVPALAQGCNSCGTVRVTANFQVWTPVANDGADASMGKAVAQASEPLYDVVARQCDVLAAGYKGDCRVVEFRVNAGINERPTPQFVAPGQRLVAQQNVNAVFEITPTPASKATPKP